MEEAYIFKQYNFEKISGSTYILLFYLNKPYFLNVGKLGTYSYHSGYYIYIGSAKKNLRQRLERHLRREKNLHWHIDYLLSEPISSEIISIWTSPFACECNISCQLFKEGIGSVVIKGFGSSDCKCVTHLFKVDNNNLIRLNYFILSRMEFSSLPNL